jgi:phenylpyruvate tautomerase PptA (4-oxalocrotonate tautomerase family)
LPAYKLDPDWVYVYLEEQEQKLANEVSPEQKEEIMDKIREMTLSILYKQAKRFHMTF